MRNNSEVKSYSHTKAVAGTVNNFGSEIITSSQNKLLKQISSLREKKFRDAEGLFVVEGEKFVRDLPASVQIECYVVSESFSRNDAPWISTSLRKVIVTDDLFGKISETVTPQGVMAICRQINDNLKESDKGLGFIVLCEAVRDPGNFGALIRTAKAAGADALVAVDCVDRYNPKVIRASAGGAISLKIIEDMSLPEAISFFSASKFYGASLSGKKNIYETDLTGPIVILIGNEGCGLSPFAQGACHQLVRLPMPGQMESLNAAVAGGIIIYEAVRQRLNHPANTSFV